MKVKSESEVAQSWLTLSNPMDWGLPGSSVHGIFQARVLEWVDIPKDTLTRVPTHTYTYIHTLLLLTFMPLSMLTSSL